MALTQERFIQMVNGRGMSVHQPDAPKYYDTVEKKQHDTGKVDGYDVIKDGKVLKRYPISELGNFTEEKMAEELEELARKA